MFAINQNVLRQIPISVWNIMESIVLLFDVTAYLCIGQLSNCYVSFVRHFIHLSVASVLYYSDYKIMRDIQTFL